MEHSAVVSDDPRILGGLVSVLKAAQLTMFERIGYSYALQLGGAWLGHALGAFFRDTVGKPKDFV